MKTYNQTNFFKHTFCEFTQDTSFEFPEDSNYKSKSNSTYFYTKDGVYRKSNHWGRVANCRWKLISNEDYKNQQIVVGFAKWTNFYPINSSEKIFFIEVNFDTKNAILTVSEKANNKFSFSEAQKKIKDINQFFKSDKWATYYEEDINILRRKIISEYLTSNKTIQEIKLGFK